MKSKTSKKEYTVAVVSDLHCGHVYGLTPPKSATNLSEAAQKSENIRQECWDFYASTIKAIGPVDIVVANGDLIDGRGERSGSLELIALDRFDQVNMAVRCLKQFNAKDYVIVRGTPYHTGGIEAYENLVAEKLNTEAENTVQMQVANTVFDFKHHIGYSSRYYLRHGHSSIEMLNNNLKALMDKEQLADVIVRSHVHYYQFVGNRYKASITTPALQVKSNFAEGKLDGISDFGFLVFKVNEEGYTWETHLADVIRDQKTLKRF